MKGLDSNQSIHRDDIITKIYMKWRNLGKSIPSRRITRAKYSSFALTWYFRKKRRSWEVLGMVRDKVDGVRWYEALLDLENNLNFFLTEGFWERVNTLTFILKDYSSYSMMNCLKGDGGKWQKWKQRSPSLVTSIKISLCAIL